MRRTVTAAIAIARVNPAPLDVLALRAWARALLLAEGEIESVAAAVDPLQEFAEHVGLDQDATQQILADAFAPYREASL